MIVWEPRLRVYKGECLLGVKCRQIAKMEIHQLWAISGLVSATD